MRGVKKVRNLMIPALFGVSVTQINLLINQVIASFLITGSISWLYYADRLIEFPLGLFGIAISTVILPALSRIAKQKELSDENRSQQFKQTMDWGVRMVLLLGIPAMIGIAILAEPLMMTMFMRGKFSLTDVMASSQALFVMCFGLISYMMISIPANGFYASQNTKTPVKIGIIATISNICFGVLAIPFGYLGLAMASALSAFVNMSLLYRGLWQRDIYRLSRKTLLFALKLFIAGCVMGALVSYFSPSIDGWNLLSFWGKIHWLIWLIVLAVMGYFSTLIGLGIRLKDFKA